MAFQISEDSMTLTVDDRVVAIARCVRRAAGYTNSAWVVPTPEPPRRPENDASRP